MVIFNKSKKKAGKAKIRSLTKKFKSNSKLIFIISVI